MANIVDIFDNLDTMVQRVVLDNFPYINQGGIIQPNVEDTDTSLPPNTGMVFNGKSVHDLFNFGNDVWGSHHKLVGK